MPERAVTFLELIINSCKKLLNIRKLTHLTKHEHDVIILQHWTIEYIVL